MKFGTKDVSDSDQPEQVGYTQLPAPAKAVIATSERVYALTDKKPYFYYTYHEETTNDLVLIFDITHPRDPVLKSQIGPGNYFSLAALGSILYLSGSDGFKVLELSDPRIPVTLSSTPTPAATYSSAVSISDSLLLLSYPCILQVINVSDPAHPKLVGELSGIASEFPEIVTGLSVEGNLAVVTGFFQNTTFKSVGILTDLSNPAQPGRLSSVVIFFRSYLSITLHEKRLYFAQQDYPLTVYDISNPRAPIQIGEGDDPVWNLAYSEGRVYVAAGAMGLTIYDSQNPGGLLKRGRLPGIGTAEDVAVQGDLLYIADGGVSGMGGYMTDYWFVNRLSND
jgi:hypothetical protein